MEVFRGASKVKIKTANFSNIGRDQNNNNYTTFKAKNIIFQDYRGGQGIARHAKELELSEYTEVKRGDIYRIQDIYYRSSKHGGEEKEDIYIAEVTSNSSARKFMVKAFVGPLAQKRWRREYLKFSRDRNVNLFGYNKSSIPSLIFHGELVPLAHFEDCLSIVGHYYIMLMRSNWQCTQREVWLDPVKGLFCCGPVGPQCHKRLYPAEDFAMLPPTVDFLEEDTMIRYFTSTGDGFRLLEALQVSCKFKKFPSDTVTTSAYVISTQTGSIIAFSQEPTWRCFPGSCLDSGTVMSGGLTSYCLNNDHCFLEVYCTSENSGWIAQALSVFHAHGISMDEDLSQYKVVSSYTIWRGALQKSKTKQQRRQLCPSIYIVFLPLHSLFHRDAYTAPPHIWSFHPTGEAPLSYDMCKYLGLPFKFHITRMERWEQFWPTKIYKSVYNYQIANGFNPKSLDLLQSIDYFPIFEIVSPQQSQFQEIKEELHESYPETSISSSTLEDNQKQAAPNVEDHPEVINEFISLDLLFGDASTQENMLLVSSSALERGKSQQDTTRSRLLGTLLSPFTWEAFEGSDIPAVAI